MESNYSLESFIDDLRAITASSDDERAILRQVAPLAERLAAYPMLIEKPPVVSMAENGFSFNLLHEEPDHRLAVAILTWLPSGATLPHNHGTWGVVVGLSGAEKNIFWRRLDDGSRARSEERRVGKECRL